MLRRGWIFALLVLWVGGAGAEDLPPIKISQPVGGASPAPAAASPAAADGGVDVSALPVKDRLVRLERLLDSQALVDMLMRLDQLQGEIEQLRGQAEENGHRLEGITQRQREMYLDFDRRLRQLELSATAQQTPAPTPAIAGPTAAAQVAVPGGVAPMVSAPVAAPAPAVDTVAAAAQAMQEQEEYQRAFDILKEGRYAEAIEAFGGFLQHYPEGQYAANAQYWLGEANYVMRRFDQAIAEFGKVLARFPESSKAPDAMLKLGYTYYEKQDWDRSRAVLSDLVQRFPDSTAAQLAQNRLHRMKVEER